MKKKITRFAITIGFSGKILNEIKSFKKSLKKDDVKFMYYDHALPHITVLAGETNLSNQKKIFIKLKKEKIKKFKLSSPGLGVLANKFPNLYVRWEYSKILKKNLDQIYKNFSHFFKNKNFFSENCSNSDNWIPKTTIAWKDLKYDDLGYIYDKYKSMFKKRKCLIDRFYLIDFTHKKEKIVYKILLK